MKHFSTGAIIAYIIAATLLFTAIDKRVEALTTTYKKGDIILLNYFDSDTLIVQDAEGLTRAMRELTDYSDANVREVVKRYCTPKK